MRTATSATLNRASYFERSDTTALDASLASAFLNLTGTTENGDQIRAVGWGQYTSDAVPHHAVDILRNYEIPCAPVMSMKEIACDPDLRQSGTVVEVEQKERGTYLTVGSPIKFSSFAPDITGAPLLGEHTDEVLAELGYDASQIAQLHAKKVVA